MSIKTFRGGKAYRPSGRSSNRPARPPQTSIETIAKRFNARREAMHNSVRLWKAGGALLRVGEVGVLIGCSARGVNALIQQGVIAAERLGPNMTLVAPHQVLKLLRRQVEEAYVTANKLKREVAMLSKETNQQHRRTARAITKRGQKAASAIDWIEKCGMTGDPEVAAYLEGMQDVCRYSLKVRDRADLHEEDPIWQRVGLSANKDLLRGIELMARLAGYLRLVGLPVDSLERAG